MRDERTHMFKAKKVVKDHHRGRPIVAVKFCDWFREREVTEETKGAPVSQDTQAWMVTSVDIDGRVVISCIRDLALGLLKASKQVVLDPRSSPEPVSEYEKFNVLEPRFFRMIFPQGEYNDS